MFSSGVAALSMTIDASFIALYPTATNLSVVILGMAQSADTFAIHVAGRYVGMDIFKDKHHEVDWYAQRIDKYKAETNKIIYVASDEMYRAYFNMLRRAGWKLAFFESYLRFGRSAARAASTVHV